MTSNNERLLENYVNVPHKLLGRTLQPFCLLHLLWLEYVNSPFIQTKKEITFAEVELAALICSAHSSQEVLSKLRGGFIRRLRARLVRWHNRKTDVADLATQFLAYQDDYFSPPEFAATTGERNEKIPYILLQAAALIKETGWSEDVVFTMPVGKVIWFNAALGYLLSGESTVISDKERQIEKALAAT